MDHGGHGHESGPNCSMNMLWNTQINDTCIVFRGWHISSNAAFILSCIAIVALGIFYEYLRVFQKKFDHRLALSLAAKGGLKGKSRVVGSGRSSPDGELEDSGLLTGRRIVKKSVATRGTPVPWVFRAIRALLYGATVFLSFFLMLVFMTYNAYLIVAVVVGAAIGHYIFGSTINVDTVLSDTSDAKGMACH